MKKKVLDILEFFFGKQPKIRFRRLLIYSILIIVALSIKWEWSEEKGFKIEWLPITKLIDCIK